MVCGPMVMESGDRGSKPLVICHKQSALEGGIVTYVQTRVLSPNRADVGIKATSAVPLEEPVRFQGRPGIYLRFVSGHGSTGCGKTLVFEGYGLQPVRKHFV